MPTLIERPSNLSEAVFIRFFEQAEIAKFNRKERLEYEDSLKAYRDWYSIMKTAKDKSRAEGLEKGLAEGRAEGIRTMVGNMKKEGLDNAFIAKMTGLSLEDVKIL